MGANKAHGKGLGRTLSHEKYKDVALEAFAITIDNSGNNSSNPNDRMQEDNIQVQHEY
ncbi:hypothetical protein [Mycoplasmopsis bovirhinis]|uniref:hypothetical protein n=1 Tax=Mycoplasmopsis bovirhinis TaxID=29553 RepID=UPI0012FE4210|nr:hypothetical protein [Mycoplasmopsis bovirhinis]